MRVESTFEVNTNYQENPFNRSRAVVALSGEQQSGGSFDEFLQSHNSASASQTISGQQENKVAGIFMGINSILRMHPRQEPESDDNTN